MAADTERTISKLKEIVDRDSLNYLTDEPYKVFNELIGSGVADKKTAGAILLFLVTGMPSRVSVDSSFEELSKDIQKRCCLNKKMSDTLAVIFLSLYSLQNREEWKNNELKGLEEFKAEDFEIEGYVRGWCKENGFELIDCEGYGHDDGYEPKHRYGFY